MSHASKISKTVRDESFILQPGYAYGSVPVRFMTDLEQKLNDGLQGYEVSGRGNLHAIIEDAAKIATEEIGAEAKRLNKLLDKYDLDKFAWWIVNHGYADSDLVFEDGVKEYLKEID